MTYSTSRKTIEEERPWLQGLAEKVETVFRKFTAQTSHHAYTALTIYTLYTHVADVFDVAPRLLVTSAEKRSGKSRTLAILAQLCYRPLIAANATVPAIFRSLETPRTLILDEADTIFGTRLKAEQNEDLRGLLNAGFERGTPVLRTVGPQHEPTEFHTFSPAVMAAIGQLPDTIADRAVNIRLRRRKPSETVTPYRKSVHDKELDELNYLIGKRLGPWLDYLAESPLPENMPVDDRAYDLWSPLVTVADLIGGVWPEKIRAACEYLTDAAGEDDSLSEGIELLSDIRGITIWKKSDLVSTAGLVADLINLEESRWESLTGRKLSDMLRPYSIKPHRTKKVRGYRISDLKDAFERYLEPVDNSGSEGVRKPSPVHFPSKPSPTVTSLETSGSKGDGLVTGDGSKRHPSLKASPIKARKQAEVTVGDGLTTGMDGKGKDDAFQPVDNSGSEPVDNSGFIDVRLPLFDDVDGAA